MEDDETVVDVGGVASVVVSGASSRAIAVSDSKYLIKGRRELDDDEDDDDDVAVDDDDDDDVAVDDDDDDDDADVIGATRLAEGNGAFKCLISSFK